ncbi:hypothetical protein M2102_003353 [Fusobacterium sp. PH5-7]|uniref:hypothetical protein n=1 Tax=Fusobacterium sp. PH5-7 TaxID=2940528 RepID=UPI002473297C|nr:hypothetical protein [Fusobacterium sp. PH5-7]MDH6459691.1 hypothetical protein [Fusobacterium sp. PH5-7]
MNRWLRDFFASRNIKEKKKEPQTLDEYKSQGITNKWRGYGFGRYAKGIPASYLFKR